ncbi:hypothetical protein ACFLU6_10850 [Acidobacteriota bacterium]
MAVKRRTHVVRIFEDSDKVWKVKPKNAQKRSAYLNKVLKGKKQKYGELYVHRGDDVIFKPEKTDVRIDFFDKSLFRRLILVVRAGKAEKVTVQNVKPGRNVFQYDVYCSTPKVIAKGGSPPEIIVEP